MSVKELCKIIQIKFHPLKLIESIIEKKRPAYNLILLDESGHVSSSVEIRKTP